MVIRHVDEHDGPGRHGDGPRRVHLHRLHPGDAPVGAGGQRPAVQQHHLALDVAALGREVVLLPRRPGRLSKPPPVLPSSGVRAAAARHRDVVRRVDVQVDEQQGYPRLKRDMQG